MGGDEQGTQEAAHLELSLLHLNTGSPFVSIMSIKGHSGATCLLEGVALQSAPKRHQQSDLGQSLHLFDQQFLKIPQGASGSGGITSRAPLG